MDGEGEGALSILTRGGGSGNDECGWSEPNFPKSDHIAVAVFSRQSFALSQLDLLRNLTIPSRCFDGSEYSDFWKLDWAPGPLSHVMLPFLPSHATFLFLCLSLLSRCQKSPSSPAAEVKVTTTSIETRLAIAHARHSKEILDAMGWVGLHSSAGTTSSKTFDTSSIFGPSWWVLIYLQQKNYWSQKCLLHH